jgi:hypothetical protein
METDSCLHYKRFTLIGSSYTLIRVSKFLLFFLIISQTVGLLGRVIGPSQGRYLNIEKRIHTPNIHALSGVRTHDPSVRASQDSSCLRPRGYCDLPLQTYFTN